jgi:nanoRNase/pAp phosphatase (c-di-AMP/oligoRNAs hydrolase)
MNEESGERNPPPQSEEDKPHSNGKNKQNCFNKVINVLKDKIQPGAKVAIFTHPCPDPDALGSMMGMTWLLRKAYEAEVDCYYDGNISHPQNKTMVNLLDPEVRPLTDYKKEHVLRILVDTIPSYAALGGNEVDFDIVIDHHKEVPNGGFKGIFLNAKAGSCCGTVFRLIQHYDQLRFEDGNDRDSKVATAMMVGIATDTENMLSDDTTEYEFDAYWKLFDFRNADALKKIINYKRPKQWIDAKAAAAHNAVVDHDGIGVVGIGFLNGNQRDLIADVADEMSSWATVETAIAFAVVDGDRIEGCVRSTNATVSVPSVCKELGGKCGQGGGKLGKGAYRYSLGGSSVEDEDDDEIKQKMWAFVNDKETKRIFRVLKK